MNTQDSTTKRKISRKFIFWAIILVLACCSFSLIGIANYGDSSESTEVPTEIAAVQEEAVEEVEEEPTAAPTTAPTETALPTETAGPTNTPLPTATPRSTSTPDPASAYKDQLQERATACANAMTRFSDLNAEAAETPSLMFSDGWRNMVKREQDEILATCASMSKIQPVPEAYQESYEYLVLADAEYASAMALFFPAIDSMDIDKMNEAVMHLEQGTAFISLATKLLPGQ